MKLNGANVLVAGATGALGAAMSRALHQRGCRLALAGRREDVLGDLSHELGAVSAVAFEAIDTASCTRAVETASERLGHLDALVVTVGAAAFGPAIESDHATTEQLFAVNAQAPIALATAALPHLQQQGGTVAIFSAIVADYPTPGMAAYSASKAAVSAWLTAVRREQRRQEVTVFDVRPPHMDTGLVDRALSGSPPAMPEPTDMQAIIAAVISGLDDDARELFYDLNSREIKLA